MLLNQIFSIALPNELVQLITSIISAFTALWPRLNAGFSVEFRVDVIFGRQSGFLWVLTTSPRARLKLQFSKTFLISESSFSVMHCSYWMSHFHISRFQWLLQPMEIAYRNDHLLFFPNTRIWLDSCCVICSVEWWSTAQRCNSSMSISWGHGWVHNSDSRTSNR